MSQSQPSIKNAHENTSTLKSSIVFVTPALATEWLSENINSANRTLKKSHVEDLARAMRNSTWRETGDTVKFGADGILYDGQHRLAAIILSGKSQYLIIAKNLQPEARANIDTGTSRRSVGDAITITRGGSGWRTKAAILRLIGTALLKNTNVSFSVDDSLQLYDVLTPGVDWAAQLPGGKLGMSRAPISGALALAYGKDPDGVSAFALKAQSGEGHTANSPALVFRETVVLASLPNDSYAGRRETALKTLNAVYAHLKGESMKQLKTSETALAFFKKPYEK